MKNAGDEGRVEETEKWGNREMEWLIVNCLISWSSGGMEYSDKVCQEIRTLNLEP
jgi:hypothetical protein